MASAFFPSYSESGPKNRWFTPEGVSRQMCFCLCATGRFGTKEAPQRKGTTSEPNLVDRYARPGGNLGFLENPRFHDPELSYRKKRTTKKSGHDVLGKQLDLGPCKGRCLSCMRFNRISHGFRSTISIQHNTTTRGPPVIVGFQLRITHSHLSSILEQSRMQRIPNSIIFHHRPSCFCSCILGPVWRTKVA
jgi:hypothetical protein